MRKLVFLTALSLLLVPAVSQAEDNVGFRGWGPRVGLSVNPDQVVFGAHADFGQFAKRIRFQPNVELGLGESFTTLSINGDFSYRFVSKWDSWSPYAGGGVGLNMAFLDGDTKNTADFGVSLLGGIERGLSGGGRLFLEAKLGLVDSADAKFMVGWTIF